MKLTHWIMVLTLAFTLFSGGASTALANPGAAQVTGMPSLFYPLDPPPTLQAPEHTGLLRTRSAGLDLGALVSSETLQLNLFDDLDVAVRRTELQTLADGSQVWKGMLADASSAYPESEITFSITDGQAYGEIHLGTELYRVLFAAEGLYWIQQIDPTAFPTELEPLTPPAASTSAPSQPPLAPTDDGTVADVMVLYTANARSTAGGTNSIQNMINTAITQANTGYSNSGVNFRVNLVYKGEIGYSEANFNWERTLDRLTKKNDGYMDTAHTLRNTYHADLVSLIVGDDAYCGLGWVLQDPGDTSFSEYAFTEVSVWCLSNYSLAHEMGHNMGSQHDRANVGDINLEHGSYTYSYGYQAPNRAFRTIMAYPCSTTCPRVNYWSNPEKTYGGQAMGVVYTASNAADNRRSLNNNALLFTNFRTNLPPTNPTSVNPGCTATSGVWQKTCADASFTWSGATSDDGIAGYYVYWGGDPNGTPTTWVTSAAYNPGAVAGDSTTYLRLITKDNGGQTSQTATLFTLKYDATAPSSTIAVSIPCFQTSYLVQWGGSDSGAGSIQSYNVQYRVGSGGTWTNWLTNTTQTNSMFGLGSPVTLAPGQSYFFRVQATDAAGNQEAYATGDGDNQFTYGDQFLYAPVTIKQ